MTEGKNTQEYTATAVIIAHNQKEILSLCLTVLEGAGGIKNIVIVDNGSDDGLAEWLQQQSYGYIIFDEGIQGYGKVLNAVVENFETEEFILFMEPQYMLGKKCVARMMETAGKCRETGMVTGVSNILPYGKYQSVCGMEEVYALEALEEETDLFVLGFKAGPWMIKKDVIRKNGRFCEELSALESILVDYQLDLLQKGYRHVICGNAYFYDITNGLGATDYERETGSCDREVLKQSWDMNYFNLSGNGKLLQLIKREKEEEFKVLEIGCDLGATLLEIHSHFPNSGVYGVEINAAAANIAKHVATVKVGNIETEGIPFEGTFDYIIFGDVLEHLRDPQKVIRYCRQKLSDGGCVIASIPNIMHISVMEQLINGCFQYQDTGLLDRTHIHFFTYYQILQMFQEEHYVIDDIRQACSVITENQERLKQQLLGLSENVQEFMYDTFQYLVLARKE